MKELNVYIKESKNSPDENYPNVKELGEGEFNGILWGHCFLYEGNKYYSEIGWKNMFPSYCNMKINENVIILPCTHIFHSNCITNWFSINCIIICIP